MRVDITPVGKPRMTQSDKWKQRPAVMKYRAFADELRLRYKGELPQQVKLIFYLPMPKSWSARKRGAFEGGPHAVKPDIDNLCKAVFDALSSNDAIIFECKLEKYWSDKGAITIEAL